MKLIPEIREVMKLWQFKSDKELGAFRVEFALAIQSATAKRCAEIARDEAIELQNALTDGYNEACRGIERAIRKEFQEKPE